MFIKNTTQALKTIMGQDIGAGEYYQIQNAERTSWSQSAQVLFEISSGDIVVSKTDDGLSDIADVSSAIDYLKQLISPIVEVAQKDASTLGVATSPKWAPDGWHQVYHEVEFETSKLNSIHDKAFDNTDTGFSTIKFYDANGDELTTQGAIDTDCVKTVFDFMPDHDMAIKSGMIAQIESPNSPVYLWAVGAPDIADIVFVNGGINLQFLGAKQLVGLDGTAATMMTYSHPLLGAGQGTNKIRFTIRHNAGFKHRVQVVFEYFKA